MLQSAIEHAEALRDALAREISRTEATRSAIRTLDASRLWSEARARESFNAGCEQMQRDLHDALQESGIDAEGESSREALGEAFARIRELAAALAEQDALNHRLADRAKACVDGYLAALTVRPAAYDRRGARSGSTPTSTLSQRL